MYSLTIYSLTIYWLTHSPFTLYLLTHSLTIYSLIQLRIQSMTSPLTQSLTFSPKYSLSKHNFYLGYSTSSATDLVFLGHTSVVRDCANPDWPDQLIINYQFETVQEVLISSFFIISLTHSVTHSLTHSLTYLLVCRSWFAATTKMTKLIQWIFNATIILAKSLSS